MPEVRSQKSEVRSQKSEVGGAAVVFRIRRCACCGAEYDLDNCRCRFKCPRGCGKCERHCEGHSDLDLIYDTARDRADDFDEMEFRLS